MRGRPLLKPWCLPRGKYCFSFSLFFFSATGKKNVTLQREFYLRDCKMRDALKLIYEMITLMAEKHLLATLQPHSWMPLWRRHYLASIALPRRPIASVMLDSPNLYYASAAFWFEAQMLE